MARAREGGEMTHTRRERDALIRNSRPTKQLTLRESLALPTKRKLPKHPCAGGCGKMVYNVACRDCMKKAKDAMKGS